MLHNVSYDPSLRAWSPNTLRAFRSDLDCAAAGVCVPARHQAPMSPPGSARLLGSTPPSSRRGQWLRSSATLVNVSWAYRMAALPDPTAAPMVRLETKAARKKLKTRQRQARAIRFKGDIAELDSPAAGVASSICSKPAAVMRLVLRDAALLRISTA